MQHQRASRCREKSELEYVDRRLSVVPRVSNEAIWEPWGEKGKGGFLDSLILSPVASTVPERVL